MMGRRTAGALKKLLAALVLLAVLGFSVWIILIKIFDTGEEQQSSMPPLQVHVERLMTSEVPSVVDISGFIQPRRTVHLAMEESGVITALGHEHGDAVAEGDMLVQLDTGLMAATLAQAEASLTLAEEDLALAQSRLERSRALRETEAISQDSYDAAVTNALTAESRVTSQTALRDLQREHLERHTLAAPMNGVLSDLGVEVGSHVNVGEMIGTLDEVDVLEVVLFVAQEVRAGLALGDEASVWLDHDPGTVYPGTITRLAQVADPTTRKFEVEVRVDNSEGAILAGSAVVCRLTTGAGRDALLVPKEWVINRSGVQGVFSVTPSGETLGLVGMEPVRVRSVWTEPGQYEITHGVESGTLLAVERFADLQHGQVVEALRAGE